MYMKIFPAAVDETLSSVSTNDRNLNLSKRIFNVPKARINSHYTGNIILIASVD